MKNIPPLKRALYSLAIIFIIILAYFVIPNSPEPLNFLKSALFPLVAILALIFLIQGVRLTLLARKEKGKFKLFLMLTGISAIAPLPFAILHNLFYGIAITFENLHFIFDPLHALFLIIAVVVAPLLFIIGMVGSIILFMGKVKKQ